MSSPGFYFYTGDWQKKTRVLTLQTKGAWMDMLCMMNDCKPRGILALTVEQFARFLSVSPEMAFSILTELQVTDVANVSPALESRIFSAVSDMLNFKITIESRRMRREEKRKEDNRLRQDRFREKQSSNAPVAQNVTSKYNASSSSSSISSSLNNKDSTNNKDTAIQEIVAKVVGRMNELSQKKFALESKQVNQFLKARLLEGATVEDCLKVVEHMWKEWGANPHMRRHFDPVVLFRPINFPRYLQQAKAPEEQPLLRPDVALAQRRAAEKASAK